MLKRILASAIFFVALISFSIVGAVDEEVDSTEAQIFSNIPEEDPTFKDMGAPKDGPKFYDRPLMGMKEPMGYGPADRGEKPLGWRMPPMDEFDRGVPPMPDSRAPEYNHDATPEEIRDMIPVMIEEDISIFDPGFVEDAIEYAKDNGMEMEANILSNKLSDMLSILRTVNLINSADTRANGLEIEDQNEDEIVIIEEVGEDEDVPLVFSDTPVPSFISSKPVSASPQMVCIQLDL